MRRYSEKLRNVLTGLLLLLIMLGWMVNVKLIQVTKQTIIVPDEQPTIQAGINAASSGDTVYVKARVYYENVVVNKSICLIGENRETTIIDGQWKSTVISIIVANVTLDGFTIRNADYHYSGIYLEDASYSVISNNIVTNMTDTLMKSIHLNRSNFCNLTRNLVTNNGRCILIEQSHNTTLTYNAVIQNSLYGIRINNSTGCIVKCNMIADTYGQSSIRLVSANYTNILENILSNATYGVYMFSSHYSNFCHNNFIRHGQQVWISDSYNNIWHNASLLEGNYWDDYTGQDLDSNGIGDIPYVIGMGNLDPYPIMKPWMPMLGDLNIDCRVDLQDLVIVAKAYNSTEADPNWNPLADLVQPYGRISLADLVTVAHNYGKSV